MDDFKKDNKMQIKIIEELKIMLTLGSDTRDFFLKFLEDSEADDHFKREILPILELREACLTLHYIIDKIFRLNSDSGRMRSGYYQAISDFDSWEKELLNNVDNIMEKFKAQYLFEQYNILYQKNDYLKDLPHCYLENRGKEIHD